MEKYFLRESKKVDYRKCKRNDGINDDAYDTDEELKKLYIMEQRYPGFGTDKYDDSDEDCDLYQDDNQNDSNNNGVSNKLGNEKQSENEKHSEIGNKDEEEVKDDKITEETKKEEMSEEETKDDYDDDAIYDENGICNDWDFEQLMANKTFLFNCKYRWNFCSTYFKEENLEHIYTASWPKPTPEQTNKYDLMLKDCIETVTKYHSKTMDQEFSEQFTNFSNKFRIQFCDEILLFNGMTEGRDLTNEKGRSVRVGFFRKDDGNDGQNENENENQNGDKLEMIVCYADNKQFVAECQQFFGLKIGDFEYSSRKWMLVCYILVISVFVC